MPKVVAICGSPRRGEFDRMLADVLPGFAPKFLVVLDALAFARPEIFVADCASKLDDKAGAPTDETTRGFIKQQLTAFAAFIERHGKA